jgi:hypothetical protein
MPSSVTTRSERGRIDPFRSERRLSRSRRPHFVPKLGRVFCLGLASVTVRSPAIRDVPSADGSRVQSPLLLPETRLGLTTQARRRARPARPSTEADCPARTDAGRSA